MQGLLQPLTARLSTVLRKILSFLQFMTMLIPQTGTQATFMVTKENFLCLQALKFAFSNVTYMVKHCHGGDKLFKSRFSLQQYKHFHFKLIDFFFTLMSTGIKVQKAPYWLKIFSQLNLI